MQQLAIDPGLGTGRRSPAKRSLLAAVTDRVLELVLKTANDNAELVDGAVRRAIADCRTELGNAESPAQIEDAVADSLGLCEQFLTRTRGYLVGIENELVDVVALLRQVSSSLTGGSDEFFTSLDQSTKRLTDLAQIDDIRQLKREIQREVENIQRAGDARRHAERGDLERLSARVASLESSLAQASHEAGHDVLTGLANRRTFDRALASALGQATKTGRPLVVGIIDIDDFKRINDTHGHAIGDRVLICLAGLFVAGVRSNDLVARLGGEEFALLLQNVSIDKAYQRLRQIRENLAATYEYELEGKSVSVGFTYSGGLTESVPDDTCESLVARADKGLYRAKSRGKDRIVVEKRSYLRRLIGA